MKNKNLPKTPGNNSLTFQNINLIRESLLKVHITDRTKNMENLLQELGAMLGEMSADDGRNIKVGDTVRPIKAIIKRSTVHGTGNFSK